MELIGLNTKWYRYQNNWTQEVFAEKTGFKLAYVSAIETATGNMTCSNIDLIAEVFDVKVADLFNEDTAIKAKMLPKRIDVYNLNKKC